MHWMRMKTKDIAESFNSAKSYGPSNRHISKAQAFKGYMDVELKLFGFVRCQLLYEK